MVGQDVRDLLTILKLMKWCVYYIFASVPKKKNMEKMKENEERKKENKGSRQKKTVKKRSG